MKNFKIYGYIGNKLTLVTNSNQISSSSTFEEKCNILENQQATFECKIAKNINNQEQNNFYKLFYPGALLKVELYDYGWNLEEDIVFTITEVNPIFYKNNEILKIKAIDYVSERFSKKGANLEYNNTGNIYDLAADLFYETKVNCNYKNIGKNYFSTYYIKNFKNCSWTTSGLKIDKEGIAQENTFGFELLKCWPDNNYILNYSFYIPEELYSSHVINKFNIKQYDIYDRPLDEIKDTIENFKGDGQKTIFSLLYGLHLIEVTKVLINNIVISSSDYTIEKENIIFNTAPINNAEIKVFYRYRLGIDFILSDVEQIPTRQFNLNKETNKLSITYYLNTTAINTNECLKEFNLKIYKQTSQENILSKQWTISKDFSLDDFKNSLKDLKSTSNYYKKVTLNLSGSNFYNGLIELCNLFNAELQFDYNNKTINFLNKDNHYYKGYKLNPNTNIKSFSRVANTNDMYTVIDIYGGEIDDKQITAIPSIPNGLKYYLWDCIKNNFTNVIEEDIIKEDYFQYYIEPNKDDSLYGYDYINSLLTQKTRNLFNNDAAIYGSIDDTTGIVIQNKKNRIVSDYIPIKSGNKYCASGTFNIIQETQNNINSLQAVTASYYIAQYNSNKDFINKQSLTIPYEPSQETFYIRLEVYNNSITTEKIIDLDTLQIQFESGASPTEYIKYGYKYISLDEYKTYEQEYKDFASILNMIPNFESRIYNIDYFKNNSFLIESKYNQFKDIINNQLRKINIKLYLYSEEYYNLIVKISSLKSEISYLTTNIVSEEQYLNKLNIKFVDFLEEVQDKYLAGELTEAQKLRYAETETKYKNLIASSQTTIETMREQLFIAYGIINNQLDFSKNYYLYNILTLYGYKDIISNCFVKLINELKIQIDEQKELKIKYEKRLKEIEEQLEENPSEYQKNALEVEQAGLKQNILNIERMIGRTSSEQYDSHEGYLIIQLNMLDTLFNKYIPQAEIINGYDDLLNNYESEVNLVKEKDIILDNLYTEYGQYLIEGYYENTDEISSIDLAEQVFTIKEQMLYPRITYNVGIIDLSSLENYQFLKIKIGDKIKIDSDELFLEYNPKYQNFITITGIQYDLRQPDNTKLEINKQTLDDRLMQKLFIQLNSKY